MAADFIVCASGLVCRASVRASVRASERASVRAVLCWISPGTHTSHLRVCLVCLPRYRRLQDSHCTVRQAPGSTAANHAALNISQPPEGHKLFSSNIFEKTFSLLTSPKLRERCEGCGLKASGSQGSFGGRGYQGVRSESSQRHITISSL